VWSPFLKHKAGAGSRGGVKLRAFIVISLE
jgi:hypothetical protein